MRMRKEQKNSAACKFEILSAGWIPRNGKTKVSVVLGATIADRASLNSTGI